MFTHFQNFWKFDEKTTCARCKNRPLERADGVSPPTSLGELITADHTILNLDDEVRNDHRNALIVYDGYSLHGGYTKIKDAHLLADTPASIRKASQDVSGYAMDTRLKYSSSCRNQRNRGKSCSTHWLSSQQSQSLLVMVKLGLPSMRSTVPRQHPMSQCPLVEQREEHTQ